MSANLKLKASNMKSAAKTTSRARISSSCNCNKNDHKSCGRKEDPSVESMQEAGKELSDIFRQLEDRQTAAKLVRAIRCRDAKAVQSLLDCDCRVVNFFCTRDKDCVRICCQFGRFNDVVITFDICIKRVQDECRRHNCWF
ncbi:hypothetical protein [Paenibacillus sp. Soil522]|uniref:hypothetical protein n=1 Tax=Paenibacillus sp. Soil522 TaxID=1736388 RepID=UPI0006F3E76F|nr:hypothetical protein [Paenibacillus sp. Soil522]KRE47945.1 hypothetical protein ASG81_08520 [Paenibacillus sp. Soil522]